MKAAIFCLFATLAFSRLSCDAESAGPIDPSHYSAPIRVACLSASITAGFGAAPHQSYPDQLQALLGSHWLVKNFGVSGRTILTKGDHPYSKEQRFEDAHTFNPDVVIFCLGSNDTKAQNWIHCDEFIADYKEMIETFKYLPSHPRIFICDPPPVPEPGNYGINEKNLDNEISMIDRVAAEEKVGLIDMHAALAGHPEMFPDRVHPNTEGAGLMAKTAAAALTGKAP